MEKFDEILKNKEKDIIQPIPDHLWNQIERKLDQKVNTINHPVIWKPWMAIAAGIFLFASSFFLVNIIMRQKETSFSENNQKFIESLEDIPFGEEIAQIPSVEFQKLLMAKYRDKVDEGDMTSLVPGSSVN